MPQNANSIGNDFALVSCHSLRAVTGSFQHDGAPACHNHIAVQEEAGREAAGGRSRAQEGRVAAGEDIGQGGAHGRDVAGATRRS